jgi:hypothetical protein
MPAQRPAKGTVSRVAIEVLSTDAVAAWLRSGGRVEKARDGVRDYYRVVADPPPHGGRLPEVPDDVVAEFDRRGWLAPADGGGALELSQKGRDELG